MCTNHKPEQTNKVIKNTDNDTINTSSYCGLKLDMLFENLDTIEKEIGHNTLTKKYIEGQIKKMDENNLGEEDSGEEDSEDGELGKTKTRDNTNQLEHLKKHLDSKVVECQKKWHRLLLEMTNFLWNIAEGKLANEGGADDKDWEKYVKYENGTEFSDDCGNSRHKLLLFLIAEDVEKPPDR